MDAAIQCPFKRIQRIPSFFSLHSYTVSVVLVLSWHSQNIVPIYSLASMGESLGGKYDAQCC